MKLFDNSFVSYTYSQIPVLDEFLIKLFLR